jgi:hypothetical protein
MKTLNIIFAGIAGTTAMTIFSYTISKRKKKNFKEPQLLGVLAEKAIPGSEKDKTQTAGWITHYLVGVLFAGMYSVILKRTKLSPTFLNGAIMGGISGLPAVLGWHTVFTINPAPPKTDFKRYYGHLLIAHMVFGAFTFLFFKNPKLSRKQ